MSLTEEGSSKGCSSDCLNSLQFGQKIYFEDSSTSTGTGVKGKKNGKNMVQYGQPPRCQVEGCNVDLSDSKAYYSRHKVCGMHSKSPLVVVAGIHQRFCQQCSRFHQLPEFDQGKRSCRRRLAGHNERRRKPPPGSLLSSRLGRLSSSFFGDSTNKSGFLLDFSSYSRQSGRDLWPGSKTSEAVSGCPSTSLVKFHHDMWPGYSEDPPETYPRGSAVETSFSIPSGECITGVSSDSTCALSLLSNQTWGSTNSASDTGLGNLMNHGGASMSQSAPTHTVTVAHLPNNNNHRSWNFKGGNEANIGGLPAPSTDHFGVGQFSHALDSDLFMDQVHGGCHYVGIDHSSGYSSAAASQVHWSL